MSRGFRDLHPVVTFIYYAGVLLMLLLMFHPLFILSAGFLLLAVNLLYDGGKGLFQWRGVMGMTAGVILVVNPLTSQRGSHILWEGTSHRITWEAVLYGGMMAGIILCVLAAFVSYQQVIPSNKFLYLFSRLLPQWALLTVLALRFVPLLRGRLEEIAIVHRSREDEIPKRSLRERLRRSMKRLEVLLTWSLEEGLQTADSMKARGYGTGRRSSYSPYRWRPKDGAALLFLLIAGGACLYGWSRGLGVLTIYPVMGSLGLTDEGWALLGGYLSFLGFPVLVELGGMIRE
ncbi:energy-coupling factor transporter transmembrane component T [Kroppenstedtia eburnea]|uniref:Energy-coupling factor transport system permease protein n=1 Tax=Kroppenstedtia eburnea TaxID=714067 RepID=A0A1N7IYC1_9BACL|nr:energy-coupling factor transporter transmembrane component T [Kroppenstedtia eburnea]QKI82321.1 energy-coupling factor transporter transmembrane protein EcfT [Kroppenstedtia eburnea]SIS42044.1 energy-coupling factor transport system permease protein [Kroppenstedtia eburnea]